jgi:hypothetical protein
MGHAEDSDGTFRLVFDMPDTVVRSGFALEGTATLSIEGTQSGKIMSSGSGPVTFSLQQLGGKRHAYPITADLHEWDLASDRPIVATVPPLLQFFEPGAPNSAEHLAPGDWTVTARASFVDFDNHQNGHGLDATLTFHVVP